MSQLESLVAFQITRLANKLNAQARAMLAQTTDLNLAEWRVIRMLGLDATDSSAVRAAIGLDKGQFSKTVASLTANNLIKANQDTQDKRRLKLALTLAGIAIHEKVAPYTNERNARLLEQLSDREKKQFFEILRKIDRAAGDLSFLDDKSSE
jgi:DNA-binding MarR family transcriptional regulator